MCLEFLFLFFSSLDGIFGEGETNTLCTLTAFHGI